MNQESQPSHKKYIVQRSYFGLRYETLLVRSFKFELAKHIQLSCFSTYGLRQIFDIFPGKYKIFQENCKANFRKFQNQVNIFACQLAKLSLASLASIETDLKKI
jgi:hypothetical protein